MLLHNLTFVDYGLGHTGSTHDSFAFQNTRIADSPTDFLEKGEWVWADSAYPLQTWCVTPFKKPTHTDLPHEARRFNYWLSVLRVRAEHAIGLLKGRFQSLRELRIQIGSKQKHRWAILWIRCCIILHNLVIRIDEEDESHDAVWRDFCIEMGIKGLGDVGINDFKFGKEDKDDDIDIDDDDDDDDDVEGAHDEDGSSGMGNNNTYSGEGESLLPPSTGSAFRELLVHQLLTSHLYV
jgi:hypothetical protein